MGEGVAPEPWGELAFQTDAHCPSESISHSVVSDSATPWTVALQAPLSMGFSRKKYWSGLSCPPPGNLPHPGIKPGFPDYRHILYYLSHLERSFRRRSYQPANPALSALNDKREG